MENPESPIIGITSGTGKNLPKSAELYVKAVENAGGTAFFLSPDMDITEISSDYNGFIIPGGKDLSPILYNESRRFKIELEEQERINFEISLLHEIIKNKKPVLGICYGMQLINVFFRGTLYQDIEHQFKKSKLHSEGSHKIRIEYNPYVEAGEYLVESSHHQAIKDLGLGIKPFAYAPDGIIEALYLENFKFLMGVQWHPEKTENNVSKHLLKIFIEACGGNK